MHYYFCYKYGVKLNQFSRSVYIHLFEIGPI